jgi:hypothetical protein
LLKLGLRLQKKTNDEIWSPHEVLRVP